MPACDGALVVVEPPNSVPAWAGALDVVPPKRFPPPCVDVGVPNRVPADVPAEVVVLKRLPAGFEAPKMLPDGGCAELVLLHSSAVSDAREPFG